MNHAENLKNADVRALKLVNVYLLAVTMFLLSVSCSSNASPPESPHPMAVRTAPVRVGPLKETLHYIGTVHSQNEVRILARVAGKVAELPIPEGVEARRGSVLARIAAPETGARVSRLQADVERVREESAFLCRQAEIDQNLLAANAVSKVLADGSRQKCDSSRAALRAAEAGLHELDVLAGNTVENAPFPGKVLQWIAQPGENIMPGQPILLYGDDPLEVRVQVQEKDVARGIRPGLPVILQPNHPTPIRSEVAFVSPLASGPGRMFEVRIPLSTSDAKRFRHGMSVDAVFVLAEEPAAVAVPEKAIKPTSQGNVVFAVAENRVRRLAVAPSIREGDWVAVRSELKEGDRVVVGNLDVLDEGLAVYPVPDQGEAP